MCCFSTLRSIGRSTLRPYIVGVFAFCDSLLLLDILEFMDRFAGLEDWIKLERWVD